MHFSAASQNTVSLGFYCHTQIKDTQGRLKTIAQYAILERSNNYLLNIALSRQLEQISPLGDISVEQAQKTTQNMWRERENLPMLLLILNLPPQL